jgi:hypothetical protein
MNGFSDALLRRQAAAGILNHIIEKILECFELMRQDCERRSEKIANNEITIRDHLFCKYLNDDTVMRDIGFDNFRFFSEVPENYIDGKPQGRVDLQVCNVNDFSDRKCYFIIECKRIAGDQNLNRKYIDEGIRRFVGKMPKYASYHKMNCMMGFVVKEIDIDKNADCINRLLKDDYSDIHVQDYLHAGTIPQTYISSHGEEENERITLVHVFPNCASVVS